MQALENMDSKIRIRELKPVNIEGGYLIDGFPSVGLSSAIATQSMINTSQFEVAGILDSDYFPPISIIQNESPNFPAKIFVNNDLKVAVFSSYLLIHEALHKEAAKTMLNWAKEHKCSLIVSSSAVKSENEDSPVLGIASTPEAKKKLKDAGISILSQGTVPGIPARLLNEGAISNVNVVVLLFGTTGKGPDFKSSAKLCMAMSKLVPGSSCDITSLQQEAEKAERNLKDAEKETRLVKDSMYR